MPFNPMWLVLGFILLVLLLFFANLLAHVSLWIRARMSGVPVSFLELVFMSVRKVNPRTVVDALILARQSGIEISSAEMQRAYMQGVDLEKVTLAKIEAERQGRPIDFEEFVEAELGNRLQERLQGEG